MKQSFIKSIKRNTPLIIAFIAFVFFTGNKNPGDQNQVGGRCCSGYNITINQLRQFMIDSLHGNQFEGGVYSKQNLLAAINELPGDSVYLMNILRNCSIKQGTDLAFTSLQSAGVAFVRRSNCYPCPGKACCPQTVCAARINRSCINYQVYTGFAGGPGSAGTTGE
jgi:hypothetical protein